MDQIETPDSKDQTLASEENNEATQNEPSAKSSKISSKDIFEAQDSLVNTAHTQEEAPLQETISNLENFENSEDTINNEALEDSYISHSTNTESKENESEQEATQETLVQEPASEQEATQETLVQEPASEQEATQEQNDETAPEENTLDDLPLELLCSRVESLIFIQEEPITALKLARHLNLSTKKVREIAQLLIEHYQGRGVILSEISGGYLFHTNPDNAEVIKTITKVKPLKMSRPALETLAIIAYKQPCTRAEVEDVRRVDCGGTIKFLFEKELIRPLGRKEEAGRPIIYGTSKKFLELFNLKSLAELPSLHEYTELWDEHRELVNENPEEPEVSKETLSSQAQPPDQDETFEPDDSHYSNISDNTDIESPDQDKTFKPGDSHYSNISDNTDIESPDQDKTFEPDDSHYSNISDVSEENLNNQDTHEELSFLAQEEEE